MNANSPPSVRAELQEQLFPSSITVETTTIHCEIKNLPLINASSLLTRPSSSNELNHLVYCTCLLFIYLNVQVQRQNRIIKCLTM